MQLQLALDVLPLPDALELAASVAEWIDIVEIGTPLLLKEGLGAVGRMRERVPELKILADSKIVDAGAYEAAECFRAGADFATVLAVSDLRTIAESDETAAQFGKDIVVDMICVDDIPGRTAELLKAGVRHFAVHTGIDQQRAGRTPLMDLRELRACAPDAVISVAGGINLDTIELYREADVVICGAAVAEAEDPAAAAAALGAKAHGEDQAWNRD